MVCYVLSLLLLCSWSAIFPLSRCAIFITEIRRLLLRNPATISFVWSCLVGHFFQFYIRLATPLQHIVDPAHPRSSLVYEWIDLHPGSSSRWFCYYLQKTEMSETVDLIILSFYIHSQIQQRLHLVYKLLSLLCIFCTIRVYLYVC